MLDNAMQFYNVQCGQSARHQSTIYNWMDRNKQLRSRQIIGDGLIDALDVGRRPPPNDPPAPNPNSTFSEENEFQWNQST